MTVIRPFRDEDAPALAELFYASVREAGLRHYSRRQTVAWGSVAPSAQNYLARARDGRLVLVAEDEAGAPAAYGDLAQDGHIDHLFCRPDATGTGLPEAIVARLEVAAVGRGMPLIHVHASEAAKGLFLRRGYTLKGRREFTLRAIPIHNYRLEKVLV